MNRKIAGIKKGKTRGGVSNEETRKGRCFKSEMRFLRNAKIKIVAKKRGKKGYLNIESLANADKKNRDKAENGGGGEKTNASEKRQGLCL